MHDGTWRFPYPFSEVGRSFWCCFVLLLPFLGVSLLEAAPMLGSKTAYAPAFYSTTIFVVSIAIGLAAGLITGCIGAGGGFIITPALMAAGVKGILAVGTDLFHIFAKAIMGTAVHKKLGNVSVKLAVAFLVGSGAGTFIGGPSTRGSTTRTLFSARHSSVQSMPFYWVFSGSMPSSTSCDPARGAVGGTHTAVPLWVPLPWLSSFRT